MCDKQFCRVCEIGVSACPQVAAAFPTRAEAKQVKRKVTQAKPCKCGAPRSTNDSYCLACRRALRKISQSKRTKEQRAANYQRHAEALKQYNRDYYARNQARRQEQARERARLLAQLKREAQAE